MQGGAGQPGSLQCSRRSSTHPLALLEVIPSFVVENTLGPGSLRPRAASVTAVNLTGARKRWQRRLFCFRTPTTGGTVGFQINPGTHTISGSKQHAHVSSSSARMSSFTSVARENFRMRSSRSICPASVSLIRITAGKNWIGRLTQKFRLKHQRRAKAQSQTFKGSRTGKGHLCEACRYDIRKLKSRD